MARVRIKGVGFVNFPDTMTPEQIQQQVSRISSKPTTSQVKRADAIGGQQQQSVLNKPEDRGILENLIRIAKGGTEFIANAPSEPVETARGLVSGGIQSLPGIGKPDYNYKEPVEYQTANLPQGLPIKEKPFSPIEMQPVVGKELSEQEKRSEGAGRFLGKTTQGALLASTMPPLAGFKGASLLTNLARGQMAAAPYTMETLQEKGVKDAGKEALANSLLDIALFGAGRLIKRPIGKAMKKVGEGVEMATIKPSKADFDAGFDLDNVYKHGLQGDLDNALAKSDELLNSYNNQLQTALQSSDTKLNLNAIFDDAVDEITRGKSKQYGLNKTMQNVINDFKSENAIVAPDGFVDLSNANEIKRAVGKFGAWHHLVNDQSGAAKERFSNVLYNKLKTAIEGASPENIREINKNMSEILPIEQAIIRRIPVAKRRDVLSLTDVVTGAAALGTGPKGWSWFLINKASKAPEVGSMLRSGGQSLLNTNAKQATIPGQFPRAIRAGITQETIE